MMPCRQARSVKRKPCLARKWSGEGFSSNQHCRSLGAQTDCFSQFFEMPCFQLLARVESFNVSREQSGLLQGELRCSRESRSGIFKESNITECENIGVRGNLKSGVNQYQSAIGFLDL